MKYRLGFLVLAVLLAVAAGAPAQERKLFDGGMMLHTGYLSARMAPLGYVADGVPTGIGGMMRFHLGRHLRVGGEGYVSTLKLMGNGSYVRMGWGGAVADLSVVWGRWKPYVGIGIGGGNASSLLLFDGDDADWSLEPVAVLHNEPFMYLNPYLGVEYSLTRAVHLTCKVDRLSPLSGDYIPTGARLYLGFIFVH